MSIEPRYIPVVIVAWLIAAGLIIIPRLIKKKTITTHTTNATNTDIVNAINNLHTAIYSLHNAVYTAMGIGICVIIAAIALK